MSAAAELQTKPKAWERLPCTSCQRSYKFYCPKCNIPLGVPEDVTVPSLRLPLQVHVWFQDKIKKSTAPHAKVLAPQDVEIIPYPAAKGDALPTYTCENAVVVYPSFEAETLEQISPEELREIRTMIFIDCPWQRRQRSARTLPSPTCATSSWTSRRRKAASGATTRPERGASRRLKVRGE